MMGEMSATTPASDAELLQQYEKANSEPAFSALVARYQGMVLGAAFRRTGNLELAKEIAQEVFATLARKARFLTNRTSIGGWLHQAAVYQASRTAQSEARRHARQEHFAKEAPTVASPVIGGSAGADQLAAVDEVLGFLSGADREVIVLHYFQDLSYPEMAKTLGINEAAVRQRVSRALERLGKRLRERGIEGNVVVLLLSAVAVQSTIAAPAGLAGAALASVAAGGGYSAYLLLTAILSKGAAKTAAVFLGVAGMAVLWHEMPVQGVPTPENAQVSGMLDQGGLYASAAFDRAGADRAMTDGQSRRRPQLISGNGVPRGQLPAAAVRQRSGENGRSFATAASRPTTPAGQPALTNTGDATATPAAIRKTSTPREKETRDSRKETSGSDSLADVLPVSPDYRLPGVLGEIAELGGLPAVVDELRRVELLPREGAKLYGELLEDLLSLEPAKRILVEGVLEDHFEQLNEHGIAGIRPSEIADNGLRVLREVSISDAVEDVKGIVSGTAPVVPKVVEEVLTLVEKPLVDADNSQPSSPVEAVTDVVSAVPKVVDKLKLPLLP